MMKSFQTAICRWPVMAVMLAATCSGLPSQPRCPDAAARELAQKLTAEAGSGTAAAGLDKARRYCAGAGFTLLARNLFDAGRSAEASRAVSAAIGLLEAEPVDATLLLGALRMQGAMYVERGMLSEALALIDRVRAIPAKSPERNAIIQSLSGACHHAAGKVDAAEREYLLAIRSWDSMQRSEDSVSELSNLGVLYISSLRFEEAIGTLERANALVAVSGDTAAYHRLVIANNLAVAYSGRGQTSRAVQYARSVLALTEATGARHYRLAASVYFNSAGVLRAAGYRKEASDLEARGVRAQTMANAVVDVQSLAIPERRR
jgi:tetratricopeptide (TPR) repeat protein